MLKLDHREEKASLFWNSIPCDEVAVSQVKPAILLFCGKVTTMAAVQLLLIFQIVLESF